MIKFDVLNRFTGEVQFTAEIDAKESDSRSLKLGLAVKWAVKNNADLSFADLSFADLSSADLHSASLSSADLSFADLSSADLSSANLSFANLSFADLSFADLRSANLRSANLSVLLTDIWTVYVQPEHIRIGCQHHEAEKWFEFSDEEISDMNPEALEWWKKWKPVIQAAHTVILNGKEAENDKEESDLSKV